MKSAFAAFFTFFAGGITAALATPQFTITTFSLPGGYDNSYANDINNSGDVVGSGQVTNGIDPFSPFRFSGPGVFTQLSPASGFDSANAISDNGIIVGEIDFLPSVYAGGGIWIDISNGSGGSVYAVNNSSIAVGDQFNDGLGFRRAVSYNSGTVTDLGSLVGTDGAAQARGINNSGVAVGNSDTADDFCHAVIFDGGLVTDLGTLNGPEDCSDAFDINASGQIVGWSNVSDGSSHAFLWTSGTMWDLGVLSGYEYSEAYGLNNLGHVVGFAATLDGSLTTAFYYDGTTSWDLSGLIAGGLAAAGISSIFDAQDINDSGQIVGNAFDLNGNRIGFILTPVPEPATTSLLVACGTLAIVFFRRRHRR